MGKFVVLKKPMVGYKMANPKERNWDQRHLVILVIPVGASVHLDYKCRASEAVVASITTPKGKPASVAYSWWTHYHRQRAFAYRVGQVVRPRQKFSNSPFCCDSGIHFYRSHQTALQAVG